MRRTTLVSLGLVLLSAGCFNLLTSTELIEFDVVQDGQPATPGQPIVLSVGSFHEATVDLTTVDTFEEHKDEIHRIDRLGVEAQSSNASANTTTTVSIYISSQAGLTNPANEATLLLEKLDIPPGDSDIDYDSSESTLRNLSKVRDLVASGVFSLYTVADGPLDLTLNELNLVLTLDVGL